MANEPAIPRDFVAAWQTIVDSIAALWGVPGVMINRLAPQDVAPQEFEVFLASAGAGNPFCGGARLRLAGSCCEAAARERHSLRVVDARTDSLWAHSAMAEAGMVAYLGYPLLWPDGTAFGTICAVDTRENHWGAQYEVTLEAFKLALEAHLSLIVALDTSERRNQELAQTIGRTKILRGLLPVCASCKKIRNQAGYWEGIEDYIEQHSEAAFSHSVCPDCEKRLYQELDLRD